MMRAKVLFLFGLACTGVLSARTVALWPLEVTADGRFDGRCAIDSQNDLGAIDESWRVDAGIGWTLYADGKPLGAKIYNFYHPSYTDAFAVTHLRLGSTSAPLSGAVDMWRVTMSALTPAEFLWDTPKGATIFIR